MEKQNQQPKLNQEFKQATRERPTRQKSKRIKIALLALAAVFAILVAGGSLLLKVFPGQPLIPPAVQQAPSIERIVPNEAPIGAEVSVIGSGFTPTKNSIQFGYGELLDTIDNNLTSSDGKRITFTLPSGFSGCNAKGCFDVATRPVPGQTYEVAVVNANGTSNRVKFTVAKDTISSEIDTSTWQTYHNDEFGFEVKYPAWWVKDIDAVNLVNPESGSSFQVTKNGNPDNLSLDEWFKQAVLISGRPTAKAGAERITINAIPAYKLETKLAPPNPLFEVVAIANSQGDIFSIYAYYKVQEDAETLKQILSTFRFFIGWREKVSIDLPENWVVEGKEIRDNKVNRKIVARVHPDTNYCSESSRDADNISTEKKNIGGFPFTIVLTRIDDGHKPLYMRADYCITQGNNSFTISFFDYNNSSNKLTAANAKLFDQILSTFRFIE
ncbi:MAG: hypothetical protein AAB583_05720 [Patescibacteria group bacterium]